MTLGVYAQATTVADRAAADALAERLMADPKEPARPEADAG